MATCGGCSSPARRQGTGTWASCRFSTRATPALPLRFRCTSRAQAIPSRKCSPSLPRRPFCPARSWGGWSRSTSWSVPENTWSRGTAFQRPSKRCMPFMTMAPGLRAGTVDKDGRKVTVSAFQWGRPMADTQAARAGWYFDLPVTGERVDQAALDLGALTVAINSKIPGSTATGAASCANAMGGGNQYVLSIDNGAGTYVPSTLGLLGPPVLQASDGDARVSPSDSTGQRIRTVTLHRFTQAQGGTDRSATHIPISESISPTPF